MESTKQAIEECLSQEDYARMSDDQLEWEILCDEMTAAAVASRKGGSHQ